MDTKEAEVFAAERGIDYIESSALNSVNVETAFTRLITTIHGKVREGHFDDRLDSFNFFGSEGIRQKAIEEQRNSEMSMDKSTAADS